jgi:hypothetical protein
MDACELARVSGTEAVDPPRYSFTVTDPDPS